MSESGDSASSDSLEHGLVDGERDGAVAVLNSCMSYGRVDVKSAIEDPVASLNTPIVLYSTGPVPVFCRQTIRPDDQNIVQILSFCQKSAESRHLDIFV